MCHVNDSGRSTGEIVLRRNRAIGAAACAAFLGTGAVVVVLAVGPPVRPFGFALAAVLVVPGVWVVSLMMRAWHLDRSGIRVGRRPVLSWDHVTSLEVRDVRPVGAGRGPAHVTVVVRSGTAQAVLALYSRSDAERVAGLLQHCLPRDTQGAELVRRIPDAWTAVR